MAVSSPNSVALLSFLSHARIQLHSEKIVLSALCKDSNEARFFFRGSSRISLQKAVIKLTLVVLGLITQCSQFSCFEVST